MTHERVNGSTRHRLLTFSTFNFGVAVEAGRAGTAHGSPWLGVDDRADGIGAAGLVLFAQVPAGRAGILVVKAEVDGGDLVVVTGDERAEDAAMCIGTVLVHKTPKRVFRSFATEARVALKPCWTRAIVFMAGHSAIGTDGTRIVVRTGVLALAVDTGLEALAVPVCRALYQLAGHLWVP